MQTATRHVVVQYKVSSSKINLNYDAQDSIFNLFYISWTHSMEIKLFVFIWLSI